jgi:hypothetical protein
VTNRFLDKLEIEKFSPIGSAGKKDPEKNGTEEGSSGDIDIALEVKDHDEFIKKAKELATEQKIEFKYLAGLGILSIRWPIKNQDTLQENQFVQIDLIPVKNLDYCKWSYYSPDQGESEYKGLYRNECIFACARFADYQVLEEKEGEPIKWSRYFYDLNDGLYRGTQTNVGKRGEVIKTVTTQDKEFITAEPQKIVDICFGKSFRYNQLMSFENCIEAIMSDDFILKEKRELILDNIKKNLVNKEQELPKELK